MSPIQGFVRLRKHQFGRQADFNTKVPATRAYPFSGTPSNDLAWTDPEIDTGSRDPVAAPYHGAFELTADLTANALDYNSLPAMLAAFFGGDEVPTGGGTAQTWTWNPASTTVDELDPFTYEFGDDVLTDWFQLGDGILESVEFTGPEGLGVLTASMSWRFGSFAQTGSTDFPAVPSSGDPEVPTPGLNIDTNAAWVYLKDMGIYIGSDPGSIESFQIMDALHTFTLRLSQEVDLKRFANGDQSFDIDAYGPGARTIELECTFAKTEDTVGLSSESDAWMSEEAVNRYVLLRFVSKVLAESPSTYFAWDWLMPMRYYTREEGDIGGNTTVVLTGHAFYDPAGSGSGDHLGGVVETTVINTLTEAELGLVGS
jgi:hypothetical protein